MTTEAKDRGTSVLAQLTSEVMADKKAGPKRTLTPVAGEVATKASLPNDVGLFLSNERLEAHAKELREFAADAIAIADGLDAMLGVPEAVASADAQKAAIEQKLREREADRKADDRAKAVAGDKRAAERVAAEGEITEPEDEPVDFAERFAAQQVAAQAQVFGWKCPDHDKAGVEKTSAKGRPFIGCPEADCKQFKR